MRYRVTARLRSGRTGALLEALETGRLARGEVYEEEMQRALREARVVEGLVTWTETCYCPTPLEAERSVLDVFFEDIRAEPLEGEEPAAEGVALLEHLGSAG